MSKVYDLFRNFWDIAVGIAVASAFFVLSTDKIRELLARDPAQGVLVILALVSSVLWLLAYMYGTRTELEFLRGYSDDSEVEAVAREFSWEGFLVVAGLAVCFGALIGAVAKPVTYASIAIALQIADSCGFTIVQRVLFRANQRDALHPALLEYYFYRPHALRCIGRLVCFWGGTLACDHGCHDRQSPVYSLFLLLDCGF